jgi:DNA-binding transcriptional ArsR family regulator
MTFSRLGASKPAAAQTSEADATSPGTGSQVVRLGDDPLPFDKPGGFPPSRSERFLLIALATLPINGIFLDRNIPLIEYKNMSIFTAIADPIRRDILSLLRGGEQPAGALVETLNLPQPNISKHLKALRTAGLVRIRVDGPRRLYSLDPAPLVELDEWLAPYRAFWSAKLDALGDHLSRSD